MAGAAMAALPATAEGQPPPQPTYASMLSGTTPPAITKPPAAYKGEPALYFSPDEIAMLAAPLQHALIRKFSTGRPTMEILRKEFHTVGFKGAFHLGLVDQRHILIRFDVDEDYHRCWLRGSWNFGRYTMRVLKWTPSFTIEEEPPVVPVCIGLERLPLHLFHQSTLFSIANLVGNPLKLDVPTQSLARPSVARICVEIHLTKILPKRVWIGQGATSFWQTIIYENLPAYCHGCHKLGHKQNECNVGKDPVKIKAAWKPKAVVPQEVLAPMHENPSFSGLSLVEKEQLLVLAPSLPSLEPIIEAHNQSWSSHQP